MRLRDVLAKKREIEANKSSEPVTAAADDGPQIPTFTFVRTTTQNEEVIHPPHFPGDEHGATAQLSSLTLTPAATPTKEKDSRVRRLSNLLHRPKSSSSASAEKDQTTAGAETPLSPTLSPTPTPTSPQSRRLSHRLHLRRKSDEASTILPSDLPAAPPTVIVESDKAAAAEAEARWEKRATLLVEGSARSRSVSSTGSRMSTIAPVSGPASPTLELKPPLSRAPSSDADAATADVNIQSAIRLHEAGSLAESAEMFRTLAAPDGANSALAQVLYGLTLLHGWGVPVDAAGGLEYLSHAATNSAAIEAAALAAGSATGGTAKGELVLAIYELGNCFRNGWGAPKDPGAARQYYETAANLGDVEAMEQAAWCYLTGFGGAKDKWKAAQFLRRVEDSGVHMAGESWIWKEKYNPEHGPGGGKGKKK